MLDGINHGIYSLFSLGLYIILVFISWHHKIDAHNEGWYCTLEITLFSQNPLEIENKTLLEFFSLSTAK